MLCCCTLESNMCPKLNYDAMNSVYSELLVHELFLPNNIVILQSNVWYIHDSYVNIGCCTVLLAWELNTVWDSMMDTCNLINKLSIEINKPTAPCRRCELVVHREAMMDYSLLRDETSIGSWINVVVRVRYLLGFKNCLSVCMFVHNSTRKC